MLAGSPLVDDSRSFWIDSPRNKCTWQASRNSGASFLGSAASVVPPLGSVTARLVL